jgi:hypothetical protein
MATILMVCMVTFVLCTGVMQGDFGSWLLGVLGKNQGSAIARINGKKVTDADLHNVRLRRRVANRFMLIAAQTGAVRAWGEANDHLDSQSKKEVAQNLMQFRMGQLYLAKTEEQRAETAQRFEQFLTQKAMMAQLTRKKSQAEVFQKLLRSFRQQVALARAERAKRYFSGPETDEGLFEFLLWRAEADRLDIHFTDDGVRAEVNKAAGGTLDEKAWKQITTDLRKTQNLAMATPEYVLDTLRDEFRVRLAQTWHLGYRPGPTNQATFAVTPEQRWQFYQDKCSEFQVEVVPLDVEAFVGRVQTPSREVLVKFFEKYKNKEKNPAKAEPGFKIPRRVELSWLTGDPNSPYFQKLSEFVLAATRANLPLGWQARLLTDYDQNKETDYRLPKWSEPANFLPFYLSRYESPRQQSQRVATLLHAVGAGLAGQGLGTGPVALALTVPVAYQGPVVVQAARDKAVQKAVAAAQKKRAAVAATLVLSGLHRVPTLPAGLVTYADEKSDYLPLEVVKGQLIGKMREKIAQDQVAAAVKAVKKKVDERNPALKPARFRIPMVTEILDEAKKKYGLTIGSTAEQVDKYDIAKDPNIQALKKDTDPFGRKRDWSQLVIDPSDTFVPKLLDPNDQGDTSGSPVLVWKTAITPSRVPDSFLEVRNEVIRQWKLQQAWKLATKKARALARQIAAASDDEGRRRKLRDEEARLHEAKLLKSDQNLITLYNVAPLQQPKSASPLMQARYKPFQLPAGVFKNPGKDWVEKILRLAKAARKPLVLENQSRTYAYVVVRVTKPRAKEEAFFRSYQNPDELWTLCQQHYAKLYRDKVVAQLKKRAEFQDLRSEDAKKRDQQRPKEESEGPADLPEE